MTSTGADLISAERQRQIEQEGYTTEHDAHHDQGELIRAAKAYLGGTDLYGKTVWPWDEEHFKPSYDIHDYVKAGALIAAEIDRLTAGPQ